jgi:hypothetical protein
MRKFILALCAAPLMAGTAMAAETLADLEMDKVAAGFDIYVPGIEPIGPSTQSQSAFTGKEICSACFPSAVAQFSIGLDAFQSMGVSRLGLP